MPVNKYTKSILFSLIGFYLLCGLLHFLDLHAAYLPFRPAAAAYLGYIAICVTMLFYVNKDLPNDYSRLHLEAAILMLILWQLTDLLRLMTPFSSEGFQLFLWYIIYLPINFIPTCMLLVIVNGDKSLYERANRAWLIPHAVSAFFFLLTMTNDYHRLIFDYTDARVAYDLHDYKLLYFVMMAWSLMQLFIAIFMLLARARADKIGGSGLYAYITITIGAAYFIWYVAGRPFLPQFDDYFTLSAFWLAIFLLPFEIAIRYGHIRSNFNFFETIEASSLSLTVEDREGRIYLQTMNASGILAEDRLKARSGPVYLDETHVMHSREITGGRVFWVEDMTQIHEITKRIQASKEELARNALSHSALTDDPEQIADLLMEEAAPQFEKLHQLLRKMNPDLPSFPARLSEACFYLVYIKRLYRMRCFSEKDRLLELDEFRTALKESSSFLRISDSRVSIQVNGDGRFPVEYLIFLYALFQLCVETLDRNITDLQIKVSSGERIPDADFRIGLSDDMQEDALNEFITMTSWFKDELLIFDASLSAERLGKGVAIKVTGRRAERL